MPANTAPIFPLTPKIGIAKLTAANTLTDGTGTVGTVFTAGANGARVDRLRCKALGTNVATVVRVFYNNGGSTATATNNSLIAERALPPTTAQNAGEIAAEIDIELDIAIPASCLITICIGTAVSAGWQFTGIGGDY